MEVILFILKAILYISLFLVLIILAVGAYCACVVAGRTDEELEESMLDPSDKE